MFRAPPVLFRWSRIVKVSLRAQQASNVSAVDVKQAPCDPVSDVKTEKVEAWKNTQTSKLVETAFANLMKSDPSARKVTPGAVGKFESHIHKEISEAKDLNSLLDIASRPVLGRKNALKIIALLGDWLSVKKIKLSDFEKDERFIKMCRLLGRGLDGEARSVVDDAVTQTNEDETAKMLANASVSTMVKIMSKLATLKKRSTVVLQALAFNISKSEEKLTVKQCADVLFAMAALRFHDEVLLVKTCSDAITTTPTSQKSSVIGSLARSLGIMRCRDNILLDQLCEWIVTNHHMCRPNDAAALVMALAMVDYSPNNADEFFKVAMPLIQPLELPCASDYLDAVWSLVLLGRSTHEQLTKIFAPDFLKKLIREVPGIEDNKLCHSAALKLLNIHGAIGTLITGYNGPVLKREEVTSEVPITRSKQKAALVSSVMDTLTNLLPSELYLKKDIDTGAGFILDGECLVDTKCNPLPVNSKTKYGIKIAILVLDYNDTCLGTRSEPNGMSTFSFRYLQACGYRVLKIPYSEFNPKSKLVSRVQYLEERLKSLVTT